MMKTAFETAAIVLASSTFANAGNVEQQCWDKITTSMVNKGCVFGNDLSPFSNQCEAKRRSLYKKCVIFAQTRNQIGKDRIGLTQKVET